MDYLNKELISTSLGQRMADRVVTGGRLINVYTGRISQMDVAITAGRIAAIGDVGYCTGPDTERIDAEGFYLAPGLIEPHVHPEVAKVTITAIANAVLPRGNTTIMCSLDQIGVVAGLEGMRWALDEARMTPLKVFHSGPSRLPYTTPASTVGFTFGPEEHAVAQGWEEAVGIWEYMSDSVVDFDPSVYETAGLTLRNRLGLHGHAPAARGPVLSACVAAGMRDDHESYTAAEMAEKMGNGVYCFLRRNTRRDSIDELIRAVTEMALPSHFLSLCTDDLDCLDIHKLGLIDYLVRRVIRAGLDPVTAIQMGSLNAARAYQVDHLVGSITPGRIADIVLLKDLATFEVDTVIADGKVVARAGEMLEPIPTPTYPAMYFDTMRFDQPIRAEDLLVRVDAAAVRAQVMCIHLNLGVGATHRRSEVTLDVKDGVISPDPEQDVLYISVTERYTGRARSSTGFIQGFGLKQGAIATSLSPDDNNVITIGASVEDMVVAINRLVEIGGGQVVVNSGQVVTEIALPLCGIMSTVSVAEMAGLERKLNQAAWDLGTTLSRPFFYLIFFSITAIPDYAITDAGVVERASRVVIDPILKLESQRP